MSVAPRPGTAPRPSLYQSCVELVRRLSCVPGFSAEFLGRGDIAVGIEPGISTPVSPLSDPVSTLWQCFRLGRSLCTLFNLYAGRTGLDPIPLSVDPKLSNANACKALVMRFVIALKEKVGWPPDDTFTVSQLYLNDTNGFVRVVRTVNELLNLMEAVGLLVPGTHVLDEPAAGASPRDQHAMVAQELLDSERRYVHDLETLQTYVGFLASANVLPIDTIYRIFGNLDPLVDMQRRFLLLLEENALRPADSQQLGRIFYSMEDEFAVYELFCANYARALETISDEVKALQRVGTLPGAQNAYLEPTYELPTYLIKPVQRICKYPLLLEQLLKTIPADAPQQDELQQALDIIRRITDKVNEKRRLQENAQLVTELERRVEDWKGHSLKTFGTLLLSDTFTVAKGDSEREFCVYLFERILLCCKDLGAWLPSTSSSALPPMGVSVGLPGRSRSKSGPRLRSRANSVSDAGAAGRRDSQAPLQLKGRIFLNNIVRIQALERPSSGLDTHAAPYPLQVWWRGEADVESFSLRCKNEEQLRLWHSTLQKLLDEVQARREMITAASQVSTPSTPLPSAPLVRGGSGFSQVSTPHFAHPTEHPMRPPLRHACTEDTALQSDATWPRSAGPHHSVPGPSPRSVRPASEDMGPDETKLTMTPPLDAESLRAPPPNSASVLASSGPSHTGAPNARVAWRQMSLGHIHSVPLSPRSVVSGPARSSSLGSGSLPPKTSMEFVEQELAAMRLAQTQQRGRPSGLTRSKPVLHLDSALMQRTASDSLTMRPLVSPVAVFSPMTATPTFLVDANAGVGPTNEPDWNPYFPAVHVSQRQSHSSVMTGDSTDSSLPSALPSPQARLKEGDSIFNSVNGGWPKSAPHSPSRKLTLVRVRYGREYVELTMAPHTPFAALNTRAHETMSLSAEGPTRMYHIDSDGDRVMLLDDDDLATAMEYALRHDHTLDIVIE
ncbi:Guanine nucleotide exchange factor for Cdc42p [Malassezia nana]|uniref:Guanine nucleotide exchange factor for Cdc42p n=1 Tax=Malassezia nana TaxID=180528 RepID=A0AAF0J0X2_9BASI|nr:Guanine nucleotide exchange factor for Cdc42p [Malassezia nana]